MIKEVLITEQETKSGKVCTTIIDNETGVILNSYWNERRQKPSGKPDGEGKKPHFYKLYKSNWQDVVKKKKLAPYEIGVFFMCLSFVGWESNFLIHPKDNTNLNCSTLSELLDIERMQLSETMDKLSRKGLIATVKCGNSNHYMLNSNIVFWGSKIKDSAEHARFTEGCPLENPIILKYKERENNG